MSACCVGGPKIGLVVALVGAAAVGGYVLSGRTVAPSSPEAGIQHTALAQPGDEMWAAWEKASTPGENHKHLEYFVGTWTVQVKAWMDPTQTEPNVSTGTMTTRWVHEGRYLMSDYKGSFAMDPSQPAQPFTGTAIQGYNNLSGQFENVWIDSMNTAMGVTKGTFDAASKTFTFNGECLFPAGDEPIVVKGRETTKIVSPNSYVSTMYQTMPGAPETKAMELTFTRQR